MHGKITLTVDMDKIPSEVKRILTSLIAQMTTLSNGTQRCSNLVEVDLLEAIDDIVQLRKQLTSLDLSLEDCYSILVGYLNHEAQKRLPAKNTAQEVKNDNVTNE